MGFELRVLETRSIHSIRCATPSVTRFGKISPLWENFDGLFSIWQNFDPTVAKTFYHWASFHCCKWANTKYNSLDIWSIL